MSQALHFELVSPERLLMDVEADSVVVPGTDGDFQVLPNHAPVMSTVRTGMITVSMGGQQKELFVNGGFAEVTPTGLVILAEEAIAREDMSKADIEQRLQQAKEDMADAATDERRQAAVEAIAHYESMLAALN